MDRTYFEIKVTFVHILILILAIVLLGILLFYMGYRAGFRTGMSEPGKSSLSAQQTSSPKEYKTEEIHPVDEREVYQPPSKNSPSTRKEIQKTPESNPPIPETKKATAAPTALFSIRVGAFSSKNNAQSYAQKFQKMGWTTRVKETVSSGKTLFYVLVGSFSDIETAKREKEKLETQEKSRFFVVPYQ